HGHAADRARMGRRGGVAPPARPRGGRRLDLLPDAHALRHAGLLPLHGEAAAQAEEGRADLRRADRGAGVRAGARRAGCRVSAVAGRADNLSKAKGRRQKAEGRRHLHPSYFCLLPSAFCLLPLNLWQNASVLLLLAATVLTTQADLSIDNYALSGG